MCRSWACIVDLPSSPSGGSPQASPAACVGVRHKVKGVRLRAVGSQTPNTESASSLHAGSMPAVLAPIQVHEIPAHAHPFFLELELGRKPIPTRLSSLFRMLCKQPASQSLEPQKSQEELDMWLPPSLRPR